MLKSFFRKFIGLVFASLFLFSPAFAADFSFEDLPKTILQNQELKLDISVDAKENFLNALGGKLAVPNEYFTVKQILTGETGISFWVEEPSQISEGVVAFSGIVTNGFTGKIRLFSVILSPKKPGETSLQMNELTALFNDGKGSPDSVNKLEARITISPAASGPVAVEIKDTTAPEFDTAELITNAALCQGKYAVIFHAADKETGVSAYEVLEQRTFSLFGLNFKKGDWKKTQSPHCLSDQNLHSDIYVKAADMSGNSATTLIPRSSPILWYENILLWGIISVLALLSIALFLIYAYRRGKK